MTKKFLSVLAMLSIAAMMMLSSCTAAGVECGLIGKWIYSEYGHTTTVEITTDDKIIVKLGGKTIVDGEIIKVDDHEVTYKYSGFETKMKYSDLGCDTVKFDDIEYKKFF